MAKLSVAEVAEKFKVSKEAIHNRIRRGSLDCVIEHGVKYVLLDESSEIKDNSTDDKYHAYIEDENRSLKKRIKELQNQNNSLRDEKERMLIEEKCKIEQIYKERDEQLKQILHTITSKFLPHFEQNIVNQTTDDIVDVEPFKSEPIRLKSFLKLKGYKPSKYLRIKNRFKRLLGQDARVFKKDGKIFVDPTKFDYKDLLG